MAQLRVQRMVNRYLVGFTLITASDSHALGWDVYELAPHNPHPHQAPGAVVKHILQKRT